jgi:pimeloyl-ACP methyl ester carboxylesterase
MYYEIHGSGFPLILIRGLGSNADHWYSQTPAFSKQSKVIIFDNRGIGRSGGSKSHFDIPELAKDTVALMDAIEVPIAHILGLSLGGMIAQEVALSYPDRIRGLVLASAHCGGKRVVRVSDAGVSVMPEELYSNTRDRKQKATEMMFSKKTLAGAPEVVENYLDVSSRYPPSEEVLQKMRNSVQAYDSFERLPLIQAPTLVISGEDDILVAPENSRILAARIPGAQLEIIKEGGHQLLIEKPDESNRIIMDFLIESTG